MQKIILTVTNDLSYDQRMIRIASSLTKGGYQVLLVGRQRPQSIALVEQIFQQKRLKCWFDKGKLFYIEYNIRLFLFLFFTKYNAVCSIDLDTILAGYYNSKIKRKICIYDAHEYFTELPEVVLRPKTKAVWEWVAQQTIPNIKYAYTVCQSLQKVFAEKYQTPFEVVRNVPFEQKQPTKYLPLQSPIVLLYQGALNDGRGLEESIKAMQYLDNCELWLAGEGDLSAELRALSQELNLSSKVVFLGYILPQELANITPQCHIGINLLQNKGLNYYYSLANKFFDYIQAGKPSLNMNFPEYAHLIQKHKVGLLLDNLEPETIVKAVQKLQNKPKFYQQLQTNCQAAAKEFVWEKEQKKLLAFYQKIFQK